MSSLSRSKPLKSSGPLKRKKRINPVRSKPRPGRVKGKGMTELRRFVYDRDAGKCHGCGKWVSWKNSHLAHIRNKRMWGDSPENACIKCEHCHIVIEHTNGGAKKICPPKPPELQRRRDETWKTEE